MTCNEIELSKDRLNVIVAFTDKNRYIAFENDLPWKRNLKGDMRFINKLIRINPDTAVIVGRKTYETLPKMNGINLFVVGSMKIESDNVESFRTLSEAIDKARSREMYVVIFGGVGIYEEAMKNYNCKMFCTIVKEGNLSGDRIFPEYNAELFNISEKVDDFIVKNEVPKTWKLQDGYFFENGFEYRFFESK